MPPHVVIVALALVLQPPTGAPAWKTFESTNGGFSVALPAGNGSTRQRSQTQSSPIGKLQFFILERTAGNQVFMASKLLLPVLPAPGQEAQFLETLSNSIVEAMGGGRIASKRTGNVGGNPALDLTIEQIPAGSNVTVVTRARYFIVGQAIYYLAVAASEAPSPDAVRFFTSLKVDNQPLTTAASKATGKAKAKATLAPSTASAPSPDPSLWLAYTSKGGACMFKMPLQPARQEEPGILGASKAIVLTSTAQGVTYTIQFHDLPETATARGTTAVLDSARDELAKAAGGTASKDQPSTLGNVVGREYRIDAPALKPDVIRARSILSGARVYDVFVTGPESAVFGLRGNAFFDSFELVKP